MYSWNLPVNLVDVLGYGHHGDDKSPTNRPPLWHVDKLPLSSLLRCDYDVAVASQIVILIVRVQLPLVTPK